MPAFQQHVHRCQVVLPHLLGLHPPSEPQTPKCGKTVKLFAHSTEVLSLIPLHLHPYTLKEFWRFFYLNLIF
jgi:hypothetical protein